MSTNHVAPHTIAVNRGDAMALAMHRCVQGAERSPIDVTEAVITARLHYGEVLVQALTVEKTDPAQGRYVIRATEAETATWPRGYLWIAVSYDGPTQQDRNSAPPIPLRSY